jgi:hypothetical protein
LVAPAVASCRGHVRGDGPARMDFHVVVVICHLRGTNVANTRQLFQLVSITLASRDLFVAQSRQLVWAHGAFIVLVIIGFGLLALRTQCDRTPRGYC